MSAQQLTRLNLYESMPVVPIQTLGPGTETVQIASYGNSLLATLWVKDIDPATTVLVRWYDIGPGSNDYPGEKIFISQHAVISTADTSDRRLVPGIHNKVWCEITIVGGSATFGIYATSVSSFPQQSPFKDEDIANLASDAGNVPVLLDRDLGKYFLATGKEGATNVNIVGGSIAAEIAGDPLSFREKILTDGTLQTLITQTVPAGKLWKIRKIFISARCYGEFYLTSNGVIIAEGKTSPIENNIPFSLAPYMKLEENLTVEISFKSNFGPQLDVLAFLYVTEEPK